MAHSHENSQVILACSRELLTVARSIQSLESLLEIDTKLRSRDNIVELQKLDLARQTIQTVSQALKLISASADGETPGLSNLVPQNIASRLLGDTDKSMSPKVGVDLF